MANDVTSGNPRQPFSSHPRGTTRAQEAHAYLDARKSRFGAINVSQVSSRERSVPYPGTGADHPRPPSIILARASVECRSGPLVIIRSPLRMIA